MANYKILKKTPISISEVEKVISENREVVEELSYREDKILNNLHKINKGIDFETFKKIKVEFEKENFEKLEEKQIVKIIDSMPVDGVELRAIIANTGTLIVDEEVKKILDILNQYR